MTGLGLLLRGCGYQVSGCDVTLNALAATLTDAGVAVHEGHDPGHLDDHVDVVIASTAVPDTNPELQSARDRDLPVLRRGVALATLARQWKTVVVCGSHGKTTTTAFLAQLLQAAGIPLGWFVGAETPALGAVASAPPANGWFVTEADESDGTLAHYHPDLTLVVNLEFDHAEHHADFEALQACFRHVVRQTRDTVILNAADAHVMALASHAGQVMTFDPRHATPRGTPGQAEHNVVNALAAATAARRCGANETAITAAVPSLALPRRRFEVVSHTDGIRVISDYAHHPTEIRALIAAARNTTPGRLLAAFQPHRYSRTRALAADFPAAFGGVDELALLPVYAASEPPIEGGRAWDLYREFRRQNLRGSHDRGQATAVPCPRLASSIPSAWRHLRSQAAHGDTILIVGAGDIEQMAALTGPPEPPVPGRTPGLLLQANVPLGPLTTYKVGGCAEYFAKAASEPELSAVLAWGHAHQIPVRVFGAGSNVLISDCGVAGVVVRLAGAGFTTIEQTPEGVQVGAGVPLARLLAWCEANHLGGLEFMNGIPGTIGGALRMNAGAYKRSIYEQVIRVHCLNRDGTAVIAEGRDLDVGYRKCGALAERIAVSVLLRLDPACPDTMRAERERITHKRRWMTGLRSAGSVFKNPDGDYAGRLIEATGLIGTHVGGARVFEGHANFIVTETGATASDVKALIEQVRDEVAKATGVVLENEVVELG